MSKTETRRILKEHSFGRERSDEFAGEAAELLHAHWDEVSIYKDIPLDPNIDTYRKLEDANVLRSYTVRLNEDNRLIGYAIFMVSQNMHYQSSKQANLDIIFIHKEFRGFGRKFIIWCDERLTAEKVQVVYYHIKAKHNFGPMMERMGYELQDLIYSKRLDKWQK